VKIVLIIVYSVVVIRYCTMGIASLSVLKAILLLPTRLKYVLSVQMYARTVKTQLITVLLAHRVNFSIILHAWMNVLLKLQ